MKNLFAGIVLLVSCLSSFAGAGLVTGTLSGNGGSGGGGSGSTVTNIAGGNNINVVGAGSNAVVSVNTNTPLVINNTVQGTTITSLGNIGAQGNIVTLGGVQAKGFTNSSQTYTVDNSGNLNAANIQAPTITSANFIGSGSNLTGLNITPSAYIAPTVPSPLALITMDSLGVNTVDQSSFTGICPDITGNGFNLGITNGIFQQKSVYGSSAIAGNGLTTIGQISQLIPASMATNFTLEFKYFDPGVNVLALMFSSGSPTLSGTFIYAYRATQSASEAGGCGGSAVFEVATNTQSFPNVYTKTLSSHTFIIRSSGAHIDTWMDGVKRQGSYAIESGYLGSPGFWGIMNFWTNQQFGASFNAKTAIRQFTMWNQPLSDSQIRNQVNFDNALNSTPNKDTLHLIGTSLSVGPQASKDGDNGKLFSETLPTWNIYPEGMGGTTSSQDVNNLTNNVIFTPDGLNIVLHECNAVNDNNNIPNSGMQAVNTLAETNLLIDCFYIHQQSGAKVIIWPPISSYRETNGWNTNYLAWLVANASGFADGVVWSITNQIYAQPGAYANTAYFPDNLHPSSLLLTNFVSQCLPVIQQVANLWQSTNAQQNIPGNLTISGAVKGILASELGGNSLNSGIVFDLPLTENSFPAYDRISGQSDTAHNGTWITAQSGYGVYTAAGGVELTFATNLFNNWTNMTLDVVFKATNTSSQFQPVAANTQSGLVWDFQVIPSSGTMIFYVGAVGNALTVTTNSIWDGNYHEITGTYDGSNMKLYVDAVSLGTNVLSNYTISNNLMTQLAIGAMGSGGVLNNLRVYNRSLNQTEISSRYNTLFSVPLIPKINNNYNLSGATVSSGGQIVNTAGSVNQPAFSSTNNGDRYILAQANEYIVGSSNDPFAGVLSVDRGSDDAGLLTLNGTNGAHLTISTHPGGGIVGNNDMTITGFTNISATIFTGDGSHLTGISSGSNGLVSTIGPWKDIARTNVLLVTDGDSLTATNLTSHDSWVEEFRTNWVSIIPGVNMYITNMAIAGTTISQMITRWPTSTLLQFNTNSSSVGTNQYLSILAGANDFFNTNSWQATYNLWYQYITNAYTTVPGIRIMAWTVPNSLQYNQTIQSNIFIFNNLLRDAYYHGEIYSLNETIQYADMTVTNLNDGDGRHPSQLGDQLWAAGFAYNWSQRFNSQAHWDNNTNGGATVLTGDVTMTGPNFHQYYNYAASNHKGVWNPVDNTTYYINRHDVGDAAADETTVAIGTSATVAEFTDFAHSSSQNMDLRLFNNGTVYGDIATRFNMFYTGGAAFGQNSTNGIPASGLVVGGNAVFNGTNFGNARGMTNQVFACCTMSVTNAQSLTGSATVTLSLNATNFDNAAMSTTTNAFLIPTDGYYDISGLLNLAGGAGFGPLFYKVQTNGVDAYSVTCYPNATTATSWPMPVVTHSLKAGSWVRFTIFNSGSTGTTGGGGVNASIGSVHQISN